MKSMFERAWMTLQRELPMRCCRITITQVKPIVITDRYTKPPDRDQILEAVAMCINAKVLEPHFKIEVEEILNETAG